MKGWLNVGALMNWVLGVPHYNHSIYNVPPNPILIIEASTLVWTLWVWGLGVPRENARTPKLRNIPSIIMWIPCNLRCGSY